jgi:hypothetical protein
MRPGSHEVWRSVELETHTAESSTFRSTGMEQQNDPAAKPKDATKATEEQRDVQDKLDHRNDDPAAPGRHQDRTKVADET